MPGSVRFFLSIQGLDGVRSIKSNTFDDLLNWQVAGWVCVSQAVPVCDRALCQGGAGVAAGEYAAGGLPLCGAVSLTVRNWAARNAKKQHIAALPSHASL